MQRIRKHAGSEPRSTMPRGRAVLDLGAQSPTPALQRQLSQLQRAAGNQAVAQLMDTVAVQRDPTDPLARVQAATAASDVEQLIAIQHDLRKELAKDPLNPPQDVRAALATARHWTMDRVAEIRDTYAPQLEGLQAASTGTDITGEREVIETLMDEECTPYLKVLMEGHPEYRYEHFKPDVRLKVASAVRLHAARRGIAQIGHRADAETEARKEGSLTDGAWCGVFAYTQAKVGSGFDPYWKGLMQGEGGIRSALAYAGTMKNTWIWVFDHWENLKEYHTRLGATRWYEPITKGPPPQGIEPGDLVLIDNSFGTDPDHITTAVSFDGRYLTTVGGNQGSADPADESGVSRSGPFDLLHNPDPNDVTLWVTGPDGKRKKTVDPAKGPKHKRVHGIGRWSIVDFEQHVYKVSSTKPTNPPAAREVGALAE